MPGAVELAVRVRSVHLERQTPARGPAGSLDALAAFTIRFPGRPLGTRIGSGETPGCRRAGRGGTEAFATTLVFPDITQALKDAQPLDDPVAIRFPASVRRRYERLHRFPQRLLVTGDAVCSVQPRLRARMTVAALEALALRPLPAGRRIAATALLPGHRAAWSTWPGTWPSAATSPSPKVPGPRPGEGSAGQRLPGPLAGGRSVRRLAGHRLHPSRRHARPARGPAPTDPGHPRAPRHRARLETLHPPKTARPTRGAASCWPISTPTRSPTDPPKRSTS